MLKSPKNKSIGKIEKKHEIEQDINELNWSDEESDNHKYGRQKKDIRNKKDENSDEFDDPFTTEQNYLISPNSKLVEHKRRSYFTGDAKEFEINKFNSKIINNSKYNSNNKNFPQPIQLTKGMPHIPHAFQLKLGTDLLNFIWKGFSSLALEDPEMIQVHQAKQLISQIISHYELKISIGEIKFLRKMDLDDYIEFSSMIADLSDKILTPPSLSIINSGPKLNEYGRSVPCCIHLSCPPQTSKLPWNDDNDELREEEEMNESEEFRMSMVFNTFKHDTNGKVRLRHISKMMEQLEIPCDKGKLLQYVYRENLLIHSFKELQLWINKVKQFQEKIKDPLDHLFKYPLPDWLREEFKVSEILLYQHHFCLIDIDGGGTVDAEELRELLVGFGTEVSLKEAKDMLDEFDLDGGGTIDFMEFMVLIYKIQRGTVDLSNNELAAAMLEAKSQLRIFEEIEEVERHPPPLCRVFQFGGAVVVCDLVIEGPDQTPYSGMEMRLQMTFLDGYPYKQPDIKLLTRVFHVNIMSQLDGDGRLMHIKNIWDSSWSINKLLDHVVLLLKEPDLELLPSHLFDIYSSWIEIANSLDLFNSNSNIDAKKEDINNEFVDEKNEFKSESKNEFRNQIIMSDRIVNKDDAINEEINQNSNLRYPYLDESEIQLGTFSTLSIKKKIEKLNRIEKLHVDLLFLYFSNRIKYNKIAKGIAIKYRFVEEMKD